MTTTLMKPHVQNASQTITFLNNTTLQAAMMRPPKFVHFSISAFQECFPKNTICSEEINAYYTCAFASTYAPARCMVTCYGMVDGVDNGSDDSTSSRGYGEGSKGGDKDVNEQKDSTSAGSTTTTLVVLSVSASTLLVAGLLL